MDEICKCVKGELENKIDEICDQDLLMAKKTREMKVFLEERTNRFCFDVQIDCGSIILPGHKYVLSFRSKVLAEQLSIKDINELGMSKLSTIILNLPDQVMSFCILKIGRPSMLILALSCYDGSIQTKLFWTMKPLR